MRLRRHLVCEPDQVVGRVAHRRQDADDALPALAGGDKPARDLLDLLSVADRCAAELHDERVSRRCGGVAFDRGNGFVADGRHSISRRPASARPSVTSSAYSRSPPTGSPLASRVTRTRPRNRSARYAAVASPVMFGFVASTTSSTPFRSTRPISSSMRRCSGSTPSRGERAPPRTWYRPLNSLVLSTE